MTDWASDAVFYHIYPLGLTGAPRTNDRVTEPVPRLLQLLGWIDHIRALGATAVYLGPVFESSAHGYDTADYFEVDRRLGTRETLRTVVDAFHAAGLRVVFDAVLNHVGRDFWAFRDLRERGESSPYRRWFANLRFGSRSAFGDPFTYEGWHGCTDLVKLNVHDAGVREHLFAAATWWLGELGADGLRLDAADSIDLGFLADFAGHCRAVNPEAWLFGEVVHGDYRRWANAQTLDSVTNYEAYKGLWSSLVDRNYFEIAYALERQFGSNGLYAGLPLYAFADNHDVSRAMTSLGDPALLRPLYALLFTMPGVPSIYYGSEWGVEGRKERDDAILRPALDLAVGPARGRDPGLAAVIAELARLRLATPALRRGGYRQLHVASRQLAFERAVEPAERAAEAAAGGEMGPGRVVVMLNASPEPAAFDLSAPSATSARDLLECEEGARSPAVFAEPGRLRAEVPPRWARVVAIE